MAVVVASERLGANLERLVLRGAFWLSIQVGDLHLQDLPGLPGHDAQTDIKDLN